MDVGTGGERPGDDRTSEPVPLGTSLDRVLRSLRAPAARTVKTVFSEWPAVAGPNLAAHAQPIALRDGELVIEVDDPTWASQLRWLEPELRARLETLPGAPRIDRIRFRVRGAPEDAPATDGRRKRDAKRRGKTP
jgi:predicted nucleic acid-binding Zn ribbon protein